MSRTQLKTLLMTMLVGILLLNCNRPNKETTPDTDIEVVQEDFSFQAETDYIVSSGLKEWQTNPDIMRTQGCATLTVTMLDTIKKWPRMLTIDFGNGCLGNDGKIRKGKILITYNSPWYQRKPGDTVYVNTDNYYVNDNKVEGDWKIWIKDTLTLGIEAKNIAITYTDGTKATWSNTRERKFVSGYTTPYNTLDDVYHISILSGSGITRKGVSYTLITSHNKPLEVALNCRWIRAGAIEITPQGALTRIIDFGNGQCDSLATITLGNWSTTFVMK